MMTVAQLITVLQTYPQDIPVTGYNGQEETDWVTLDGVNLNETSKWQRLLNPDGTVYHGPYLDIMGM